MRFLGLITSLIVLALLGVPGNASAQASGRLRFGVAGSAAAPSDYPPGVVAAGLQAVWDLRTTAGPTLAANKVMPTNSASLPAGSSVSGAPKQVFLPFSGAQTLDRWDWGNYNAVVRGGIGNVNTFTNNVFTANDGGGRLLRVGNDVGPVDGNAVVDYSNFDATGISNVNAGATQIDATSTLTLRHSRMVGAAHINLKAFGTAIVEDSHLGTYCLNPPGGSHCESAFFSGSTTLLRVLVDNTAQAPSGGQTSPLYFEADAVGNVVASMNSVIINWPDVMALLGTTQVAGKNGKAVQLTVTNSVLKKGSNSGLAGYFVITQSNGGTVCIIDGGGNYDLVSGQSINVAFGSC